MTLITYFIYPGTAYIGFSMCNHCKGNSQSMLYFPITPPLYTWCPFTPAELSGPAMSPCCVAACGGQQ